ncbi:hypothetical protein [Paenibacillus sp. NPDC057967]|uniref:hypothetical protein n=1 Tax=Paenibacillus sp. NPDC057967 TaxID=3346293 RepID=UPI0036DF5C23
MDYRRLTLITLFAGLIGWLAIYILAHYTFIGIFVAPLFTIAPYASLLFAIIMFFMTRKWLSVERLLAVLLLLPILLSIVIPQVNHQINLYKTPTDTLIRSYFESVYFSQRHVIDLSDPLVEYNDQNKTMQLNIKLVPELFLQYMKTWEMRNIESRSDDAFARYIMNNLELLFIRWPKEINQYTLKPERIIVHAYWGNEWLMEVHCQKIKKEYVIIPPYPKLSLIEENAQVYLSVQRDDTFQKIKMFDSQEASFEIKIDLKVN